MTQLGPRSLVLRLWMERSRRKSGHEPVLRVDPEPGLVVPRRVSPGWSWVSWMGLLAGRWGLRAVTNPPPLPRLSVGEERRQGNVRVSDPHVLRRLKPSPSSPGRPPGGGLGDDGRSLL